VFTGFLISYPFPSSSPHLKVTFIDVGQGDSILVEFPGRQKMLVDGGGSHYGSFDVGERIVSPFLWDKGIKRIDYLVSTHPHPDHLQGLQAVMRNFRVGEFWEAHSYPDDRTYTAALQALPARIPIRKLFRGDILHLGKVRIEVLHPPESQPPSAAYSNNASLVLRISDRNSAFLLTGDIEAPAEKDILVYSRVSHRIFDLKYHPILRAEILKAPHHGSNSSSTWEFLQAVSPHILIVTAGQNNRYNFPHPQVLDRYAALGAAVYRTDLNGAVEITSTAQGCLIRTGRR
jgi:competence protein ComEC